MEIYKMFTKFDKRMKSYELKDKLDSDLPIILRLDGKAFHTYTRNITKLNSKLNQVMQETLYRLFNSEINPRIGYMQSDEISLLIEKTNEKSQIWFNGKTQKMVSVAASIATVEFNKFNLNDKPAYFDCRAFNIPKYEIENYFIWRNADCKRNFILTLGQMHFSHKQMQGKKIPDIIKMIELETDCDYTNVNYYPYRYGSLISNSECFKSSCFSDFMYLDFMQDRQLFRNLIDYKEQEKEYPF